MTVSAQDRGLLLGDGLFETLLWDGARLYDLEAHADRLRRGCAVIGLPAPEAGRLETAAADAVAGRAGERLAVRLTWTAGAGGRGLDRPEGIAPTLLADASPGPKPAGPAVLVTASVRRNAGSPVSRVKALSRLDHVLARAEARAVGADEAVQLNTDGQVAGAAAANLFWIEAGRLRTPALECGVLDGVMRARVLAAAERLGAPVEVGAFGAESLARAEAAFLTNSLIGVRPVSRLDGQALASSRLVDELAAAVSC